MVSPRPLQWAAPGVGLARLCAGNTGLGLPSPTPQGDSGGPVKEAPGKESRGRVGLGMGAGDPASALGSKGAKETGKKDALGTSFAFFFFFKCIYKRSFPIYSGKMFFKLRDKDFGFFFKDK